MGRIVSSDEATIDQVRNWLIKHVGPISRGNNLEGQGWHLSVTKNSMIITHVTDPEYRDAFHKWLDDRIDKSLKS